MPQRVYSAALRPGFAALLACALCLNGTAHGADNASQLAEQNLAAAEAAMNVGDDRESESLLSRIPPSSLGMAQVARSQILRCEISLKRGLPRAALQSLPSGSDHVPLYAERIEELRATALFQLGDPVSATRSLVLREHYLQDDPEAIAENRDFIWQSLVRTPVSQKDLGRIGIQDEITRGWLELSWQNQLGAAARYEDWRNRFPQHPADSRAAALIAAQGTQRSSTRPTSDLRLSQSISAVPVLPAAPTVVTASPTSFAASAATTSAPPAVARVPVPIVSAPTQPLPEPAPFASSGNGRGYALLVPLSGPFAATGDAVRVGFLTAAGAAAAEVHVYDSGASPDQALAAYRNALSEGAGVVVGPLQREAVSAIGRLGVPPVPVIALNSLDDSTPPPGNFLQFGLAPEDEARAAADQAVAHNQLRGIALVPASDWGRRVLAAFSTHLRELGGTLVGSENFESGTVDPSKMVKRLFGLEASETRHKALTAVIGTDAEFDGRRRDDIDFIFLAAKPADSRVLLPQLRFVRAGGLPLYSTSLINEGRGVDWQNARVCDMPWMLDSGGAWANARTTAGNQSPDAMRNYPRLVALGGDAWRLAGRLLQHRLQSEDAIDGASGRLIVAADGRVRRELNCSVPPAAVAPASP